MKAFFDRCFLLRPQPQGEWSRGRRAAYWLWRWGLTFCAGLCMGLVLLLFAVGVFTQTGYLLVVSFLFGGDASTIVPLLILTLKVATCSLASVTVFSGLDPDRLSNGLMWYGCPERLSFSISYAYRILPLSLIHI